MKKLFLLFTYLLFVIPSCFSQKQGQALVDSIKSILPEAKEDTNKINLLLSLSAAYIHVKPDSGVKYGNQGLTLAQKLQLKVKMALAYNRIGRNYETKADFKTALDYFNKALAIDREVHNKNDEMLSLTNIGTNYSEVSDFPKALEYCFMALKMAEEMGNKKLQISNLGQIGISYMNMSDFQKSLEYQFKAL